MPEELPERLQRLLNEKHYGKSETAWAKEAGVDFNTLRHALEGKTKPRYDTMVKLAAYLDVSHEYLETGEGQQEPPPANLDEIRSRVDEAMELLQEIARDLDARDGKS
jgi:transcriptional regulator with XRE-family HTH domain